MRADAVLDDALGHGLGHRQAPTVEQPTQLESQPRLANPWLPEERDEAVFHGVVKNLTETPVARFTIRLYDGNPAAGAPMIVEFEAELAGS